MTLSMSTARSQRDRAVLRAVAAARRETLGGSGGPLIIDRIWVLRSAHRPTADQCGLRRCARYDDAGRVDSAPAHQGRPLKRRG